MTTFPAFPRRVRVLRAAALLVLSTAASGCAAFLGSARLTPQQHWHAVTDSVVALVDSGRYDAASRVLAGFAAQHDGSHLAADALFWRALLRLDPRNGGGSADTALALLDSAGLQPAMVERHSQIALARRLARQIDAMNQRNAQLTQEIARAREIAAGAAQRPAADRQEPQRDLGDEVQRLREELAKARADRDRANAELERVRRRLTTPTRP